MLIPLATLVLALVPGHPHVRAVRTATAPTIDGRLDEPVWQTAEPTSNFTQQYPIDGGPPSERTTVRVLYDAEAVYVGVDCEQIHAPILQRLTRRDRDSESEWVGIQLDPRNEGKVVYTFAVNVSGVLVDALVTQPTDWDLEWDENWEAKSALTAKGWSAEFRIPIRVLRFDASQPVQSWGFQTWRYVAQNQEADLWASIPREIANPLSHLGHLDDLTDLKRGRSIELRPFVSGQARHLETTDQTSASGYDAAASAGLDLKWHVAQDLTLDAAALPDFAQVEADQVILNLTNYETFLPEKRPLFLEGTDVFAFPLQVFYSRRIGFAPTPPTLRMNANNVATETLVDVPGPATIYGAGKLVGRLGDDWTVGALSALTARNQVTVQDDAGVQSKRLVAPLTAYNVLRLKREFGGSGHIGLIGSGSTTFEMDRSYPSVMPGVAGPELCPSGATTSAGGRCFRDSYVSGADALWRSSSGDYVANGAVIESFVHGGPQIQQADGTLIGSGSHDAGGWLRVAKEGGRLLASASYTGAGRALDYNDLGFMQRQNLHEIDASIGYRTLEPGRFTIETSSALAITERWSLAGLDLGQTYELNTRFKLKSFWTAFVAADLAPPRYDDREVGTGVALERGGFVGGRIDLGTDPKRLVVIGLSTQVQAIQHDAQFFTAAASLTLSPVPQFDISLAPQVTWSSGEPRYATVSDTSSALNPVFGKLAASSVSATLRADYTFAPRVTLGAYAQAYLADEHFTDLRTVAPPANLRVSLATIAASAATATTNLSGNPDLEQAALNLNLVFRWEYRLGSTLYLVYARSQVPQIANIIEPTALQPRALGTRSSADVILLKLSYWWAS